MIKKLKNIKILGKISNILLNILVCIFLVIFLISVYTGVQTKILGNHYSNFFGYSVFEVQTGSMEEEISPGDWIIIKLTNNVKVDDIITYELGDDYITHRVIETYNGTYVTKGDANGAKDDPIDQKQIVGKVVKILGNVGIFRKTLFNPGVLIALIITLILFNLAFKKSKPKSEKVGDEYLFFNIKIKDVVEVIEKIKVILGKKKKKLNKPNENLNTANVDEKAVEYKDERTSLFRLVTVDGEDVNTKQEEQLVEDTAIINQMKEQDVEDVDLEKTSLFRIISVDRDEVNHTLLEIAQNEINVSEKSEKSEKVKVEREEVEEENSDLTKINLDMLKEKSVIKKGKNIIDSIIIIKKEEIKELTNILLMEDKKLINRPTIENLFLTAYIDAKYYGCYRDELVEYKGKNQIIKMVKLIDGFVDELIKNYKGTNKNYNYSVDLIASTFALIANLDGVKDTLADSKVKNEFYKEALIKQFPEWSNNKVLDVINAIKKIQLNYSNMTALYLEKLKTNTFILNLNEIMSRKNMYAAELEHNVYFSKVYSDYIIDKTYMDGIIAEDKLTVLLTLLSIQLVEDMEMAKFNNKYFFYITHSLYSKEKKLEKILRMIDDKHAMESVIIILKFEDLLLNKTIIKKLRKMGYRFALAFNKDMKFKEKDKSSLYVVDYIFIDKKSVNLNEINSFVPKDLSDNIIYDNIESKVGGFWEDE